MEKLCSKCTASKDTNQFWTDKTCVDNLSAWCKACHRGYKKVKYKSLTELERQEHMEQCKRWRIDHPEARKAITKRYRSTHPEMNKKHVRKRKAWKLSQFIEHVDDLVLLEIHDGVCGICNQDVDPFKFEIDHIIPLSKGGFHNYENTQPAHSSCNRVKGDRL